jgi:hypothetical protein
MANEFGKHLAGNGSYAREKHFPIYDFIGLGPI